MILGKIRSRFSRKNDSVPGAPDQPAPKKEKQEKKPKTTKRPKDEKFLKSMSEVFREFKEKELLRERFAILALGNDLKGDEGVGFYVADKLRAEFKTESDLLIVKTPSPENHARQVAEFLPTLLVIIDAADFGRRPGSIRVIKEYQISGSFVATHYTPLALFLKAYSADQPVKRAMTIIGIQKKSCEIGQAMTPEVRKAGDRVAGVISELYKNKTLGTLLESEIRRGSGALGRLRYAIRKK
jgi:hydrogenase 3 maturation protease